MTITDPGMYDTPHEEYHSDCCSGPSLSSTGARLLATQCPAVYKWQKEHPPVKEEFEIGNATHLLTLEPERFEQSVVRIPLDSYKSKDAQEMRDAARAGGRIPLSLRQQDQVDGMRAALTSDPIVQFALKGGVEVEKSLFARDPEFDGIWVKCRPDIRPKSHRYLADVKTTTNADPEAFARSAYTFGYHMQAAWYRWVVDLVLGYRPESFYFLVVQKTEPYFVTTIKLDDEAMGWGDIQNRYARGIFAWCLEHNEWPSYRPDITQPPAAFTVGLPGWAKRDLEQRHEAGAFTIPQERTPA